MKLQVVFELPLPQGYEPFLKIIAETHGYSESACSDTTVETFVCKNVCELQITQLFANLIQNALNPYFGLVGRDQVQAILSQYTNTSSILANIVND